MESKVVAAIIAAVNTYLLEETQRAALVAKPPLAFSPWKVFGRQEQMRLRTALQQRVRR